MESICTSAATRYLTARPRRSLTLAFLTLFMVAFVAGREQMKYEIRFRLYEDRPNLQNALAGGRGQDASAELPRATANDRPVTMKLLTKDFTTNILDSLESINTALEHTNVTAKDVDSLIGTLIACYPETQPCGMRVLQLAGKRL